MTSESAYLAVERDFSAPETRDAVRALSEPQRVKLHQYWLDRASGELTTALTFEFMQADLEQEGAPAELIALAGFYHLIAFVTNALLMAGGFVLVGYQLAGYFVAGS